MATFKNKPTKVPQLHVIPTDVSPAVRQWMVDMQEALEIRLGRRGDQRDRAVTLRELIESGLAKDLTDRPYDPNADNSVDFVGNIEYRGPEDLAVPPTPSGLTATGAFTTIKLTWNGGYRLYGNHSYTRVFRHTSNALGDAIEIAAPGKYNAGYLDEVGYGQTYYYWIRHVSVAGVEGPYSSVVSASTVADIGATMAALSETLADLPGYNLMATSGSLPQIIKQDSEPSTRPDGSALQVHDQWADTNDNNQIYTRNAANNDWVKARDSSLVTLVGATSFTGSTVTGAMATAQGDITTVTNAHSATSTSLTNLSAYVGSGNDNSGTAYSASNTVISHVNATDANAAAAYVLKVEANGAVAGMVLEANASDAGTGSAIQFQADKFAIWDGSGAANSNSVAPFIVDSGIVYMDIARIKDGAITSAKIGTLEADKIDAGIIDGYSVSGVSVSGDTINAGQIRAERLGVGNINASISMSSPVISGGNITGQTITAGTLNVAKGAESNTIGKVEGHKGATVWMPNNFSDTAEPKPGNDPSLYYAGTFANGQNPYHYRTGSNTQNWLDIISNGGATAGLQIVVPNIRASVTGLSITNAGSGYSADGSLTMSFSGGGGSGAAGYPVVAGGAVAKAYLTNGAVSSIAIANSGVGYSSAPIVSFSGGGGSGAAGTAVISNSVVTSITITNAGSGYTTAPTIAFSGGGTGTVTSVHITNPGSGYTSAPTIAFSSGAAAATATISGQVVSSAYGTANRITYFVEWNANMYGEFNGDEKMMTVCSISTADAWNTNSNWWTTAVDGPVDDDGSSAGWAWNSHGAFTIDLDVNDTYYLWVFGYQYNVSPNTVNGSRRYGCDVKWFAIYK